MKERVDLRNKKIGMLTVIEKDMNIVDKKGWHPYWICKCDCGNVRSIRQNHLRKGMKSCGCLNRNNLEGQRFGKLTVLQESNNHKPGNSFNWICRCDCGNTVIVDGNSLKKGNTKSCGCFKKEKARELKKIHNLARTPLYNKYYDIRSRCYNPNNIAYHNYGGRGIKMCDEWKNDFIAFYNWAINSGYKKGLTIDRINVNGNYEPSNCRWLTLTEQSNNKRNSINITIKGISKNLRQWIDFMKWDYNKYYARKRYGRTIFREEDISLIIKKLEEG